MVTPEQTIDLGAHTVDIAPDQAITIANETIAVQLDSEETYRLFVILLEVFSSYSHE